MFDRYSYRRHGAGGCATTLVLATALVAAALAVIGGRGAS